MFARMIFSDLFSLPISYDLQFWRILVEVTVSLRNSNVFLVINKWLNYIFLIFFRLLVYKWYTYIHIVYTSENNVVFTIIVYVINTNKNLITLNYRRVYMGD